jgi:4-hydroxy-tetrahydrodipicolinate reductase
VDFTLPLSPQTIIPTAPLYCDIGVPFVMGTTGGDRKLLEKMVMESKISAVIATNMSPEIVLFQQMLKFASESFPKALADHKLLIQESHQPTKKDISGTAIGLLDYFRALGMQIGEGDIIPERRPLVQEVVWGLRQQEINGHADHIYTILSPDGSVMLQFRHTVRGRQTYVDGALRAIRFLAKGIAGPGHVWSMADVLR